MVTKKNMQKTTSKVPLRATQPRQKAFKKHQSSRNVTRIVILSIMGIAVVVVIGCLIFALLNQPEKVTKEKTEALAKDYYQNIYYAKMAKSPTFSANPEASLGGYTETGLPPLPLEQLFSIDEARYADDAAYIKQYCDTSKTTIVFYPEAPYAEDSFHTKIIYSCEF